MAKKNKRKIKVKTIVKNRKRILTSGNFAVAKAALKSGCSFYAGYPITPQNNIPMYMSSNMHETQGVFIQAESEIAAINMVFGAAAAGARAMTTSSSPGISLKQEGISYIAGAQLPCVIVNVMRGGPGLGNIAPSQADYFQATKGGGHGDYRLIVLAPSCVQESFDLTMRAFDLADKYRNPVMILTDGMLGQMREPVFIDQESTHCGSPRKSWALSGCKGRKPNIIRSFFMAEGALEDYNEVLQTKYNKIKEKEVYFEEYLTQDADIIIVAYGSMARIAKDAVDILRSAGHKAGVLRPISLWPYPEKALEGLSNRAKIILVVEMSSGQMLEDVARIVKSNCPVHFHGRLGGGIPSQEEIVKKAEKLLK